MGSNDSRTDRNWDKATKILRLPNVSPSLVPGLRLTFLQGTHFDGSRYASHLLGGEPNARPGEIHMASSDLLGLTVSTCFSDSYTS